MVGQKSIEFIFVCDANFGMLRDYNLVQKAIEVKKRYGFPHVLSVQATKNARERSYKIQKLLFDGGLHKSVNIAMQATHSDTLKNIKRDNISLNDYKELQRRFISDGIPTYSDLIIGLPGDNYQKFKSSVDTLFNSGQHYRVQFNNLSILPNAEMAQPEDMDRFKIKTKKIPVVSMHGSADYDYVDTVYEEQELVIKHKDMTISDWVKIRTFASATEFYYYNKILQIPILIMCKVNNLKLSEIIEHLIQNINFKSINDINKIFTSHANNILKGKYEFIIKKMA